MKLQKDYFPPAACQQQELGRLKARIQKRNNNLSSALSFDRSINTDLAENFLSKSPFFICGAGEYIHKRRNTLRPE
jgi:hypothetical protein